jgi:hypothetical protein
VDDAGMSEPLRFTLPVTVGRISMHVDRSVSVTVRSALEIGDDDFAIIHKSFQRVGWFLFSETNLGDSDVPKEDIDRDIKSQAQIIRNKCYRLHKLKEEAGEDVDFDVLYRQVTNWLIARLDQRIAEYD